MAGQAAIAVIMPRTIVRLATKIIWKVISELLLWKWDEVVTGDQLYGWFMASSSDSATPKKPHRYSVGNKSSELGSKVRRQPFVLLAGYEKIIEVVRMTGWVDTTQSMAVAVASIGLEKSKHPRKAGLGPTFKTKDLESPCPK